MWLPRALSGTIMQGRRIWCAAGAKSATFHKSLEQPRGPYGMYCRVEISALWNARADSLSRRYAICVNYFDVCADIKSALALGQIWYRTYGIVRPSHPRTAGLWITRRSRRHMVERCNWEGDGRSPP